MGGRLRCVGAGAGAAPPVRTGQAPPTSDSAMCLAVAVTVAAAAAAGSNGLYPYIVSFTVTNKGRQSISSIWNAGASRLGMQLAP